VCSYCSAYLTKLESILFLSILGVLYKNRTCVEPETLAARSAQRRPSFTPRKWARSLSLYSSTSATQDHNHTRPQARGQTEVQPFKLKDFAQLNRPWIGSLVVLSDTTRPFQGEQRFSTLTPYKIYLDLYVRWWWEHSSSMSPGSEVPDSVTPWPHNTQTRLHNQGGLHSPIISPMKARPTIHGNCPGPITPLDWEDGRNQQIQHSQFQFQQVPTYESLACLLKNGSAITIVMGGRAVSGLRHIVQSLIMHNVIMHKIGNA